MSETYLKSDHFNGGGSIVLLRLMLAVAPCTENEALLAVIVPLLYCNVFALPPLLKRKPKPPFPDAVTSVPFIVTLPPFCRRPPAPLTTKTEPPVITMPAPLAAFTPASPPLPVTLTATLFAVIRLPAPVARSPFSPPPTP